MIEKINTQLDRVRDEIKKFFNHESYILNLIQGMDTDSGVEIHWVFSHRVKKNDMIVIIAFCKDEIVPTIVDIAPNSSIFESELVDLFGIEVDGAKKGLFLDVDGKKAPLRKG